MVVARSVQRTVRRQHQKKLKNMQNVLHLSLLSKVQIYAEWNCSVDVKENSKEITLKLRFNVSRPVRHAGCLYAADNIA